MALRRAAASIAASAAAALSVAVMPSCAGTDSAAGSAAAGATGSGPAAVAGPGSAAAGRPSFAPCPEVSCASKADLQSFFASMDAADAGRGRLRRTRASSSGASAESIAAAALPVAAAATAAEAGCPPTREELGRCTWSLLHAIAAYYPESPSQEEQRAVLGILDGLRTLYPCVHCRARMQDDFIAVPPRVSSRAELSGWVCQQHNIVNVMLGKPMADCSLRAMDERWRTGSRACWESATETGRDDGALP